MSRPPAAPTRALPAHPSLVQLKKQAKELLKACRVGDPTVLAEVQRFEQRPDFATFALADAQRLLARAHGFSSWARLKQHVDGLNVEALCAAAESGDLSGVRKLAKARPEMVNVERGGRFGEMIALHFAVLRRGAEMTRALMELGADARKGVWPHRDATAAHTLASERGYDELVEIIEQVEQRRRAALSAPGVTIGAKTDEIIAAILRDRPEEAMRLLESDLTLTGACDARGASPLHVAAWKHNPQLVAWLLERQAPVDARDAKGKTPLDYAAFVAGWSAHGRDFSMLDNSRVPPARFEETVRLLRSKGAELTPRAAVAIGHKQAVRQMHREGRLNNEIHQLRGGLLSIAVRVNRADMVSLLLDLGLDPDESGAPDDASDARSWGMPLWFAAMCGRLEIAERLLDHGADVNAIVHACGDPMSIASGTCDEQMISLLLSRGARITVERVAGNRDRKTAKAILDGTIPAHSLNVEEPTPTDLAEQMLWAAGGTDPEIVRMCLPHVRRNRHDPWWNYVLMHARLPESFKLILEHGIDPDVAADGGYAMLHHLSTTHVADEGRLARATLLLDAGASLTMRDSLLKSTPLGWACRWGCLDLVQLYLARGADAQEPEAEPWATPLAWATKGNHDDVADLLRASGAT